MRNIICRISGAVAPGIAIGFCLGVAMDSYINGLAFAVPLALLRLHSLKIQSKN
ncbi:hypothetical protein [Shewanella sp.]|uniref:hypothetical protein n=1 Tax=Shewanella sp. TaxID=50422 RepID=UPI00356767F4